MAKKQSCQSAIPGVCSTEFPSIRKIHEVIQMSGEDLHSKVPEFLIRNLNDGNPLSESELAHIQGIIEKSSSFQYPETDVDAQWTRFKSRIGAPMEVTYVKPRKHNFAMFRWVAAAVVVLMLGIAIKDYYTHQSGFSAVYVTKDDKRTVQLPDGSTIVLNQNTELMVNAMNEHRRELVLKSGQAFFTVVHNDLPFVVQTPKGKISVLGTEFDIKAYKDQQFAVYLKKGKIEMKLATGNLILKPGQLLAEDKGEFALKSISDNREYAWIDNKLVFENTSLSEIVTVLESNFKVKFVYEERLKDEKFNLSVGELNAEQIAEVLSKLTHSQVTIQ